MRFAYADPPYLGAAASSYDHPNAHLWDSVQTHLDLLDRLQAEYPDGWAYSCFPHDLRWVLPHVPDARVGVWVKTWHTANPGTSVHKAWEPVVWAGGRPIPGRNPLVRDWVKAGRHNKTGVWGAKPPELNRFVLDLLGYQDGDTLDDLFPGSGGMSVQLAQGVLL